VATAWAAAVVVAVVQALLVLQVRLLESVALVALVSMFQLSLAALPCLRLEGAVVLEPQRAVLVVAELVVLEETARTPAVLAPQPIRLVAVVPLSGKQLVATVAAE
jgi:hypothetical protein